MENNQSVQRTESQAKAPTSNDNTKSKQTDSWSILIHLLLHHPWLFVVGLLGIFIGSSALSVYSLTHVDVGSMDNEEPETLPAVPPPTNTTAQASNPIPLWMVAAIALSCASGCLVIFRFLNRPAQYKKVQKRVNRHQVRLAQRQVETVPTTEPPPPQNSPVFVPPSQRTYVSAIPPQPKPVVTILPPQQRISLDSEKSLGQKSLADMMDIRQQTPLSSILRKN